MLQTDDVKRTRHGIPIRNIWHMLMYAWGIPRNLIASKASSEMAPTLDALLADELALRMERRLREGLGRSYAAEDRVIRGIRGRVDIVASTRRQLFERGQARCRFLTFAQDVPRNQVVKATLRRLIVRGDFGSPSQASDQLRLRLRSLVHDLREVADVEPRLGVIQREPLGRNDLDYKVMLSICSLYLRSLMPAEAAGDQTLPGLNREDFEVYRIFELFVAAFYRLRLGEWDVTRQQQLRWHAMPTSPFLPDMAVDVVLVHRVSGRVLIVDTKFTAKSLVTNQYGQLRLNSQHLYQIYAYLRTQEHRSVRYREAAGLLLYPTVGEHLAEMIEVQGHVIRAVTIDLSLPWIEIEQGLLQIVAIAADL